MARCLPAWSGGPRTMGSTGLPSAPWSVPQRSPLCRGCWAVVLVGIAWLKWGSVAWLWRCGMDCGSAALLEQMWVATTTEAAPQGVGVVHTGSTQHIPIQGPPTRTVNPGTDGKAEGDPYKAGLLVFPWQENHGKSRK